MKGSSNQSEETEVVSSISLFCFRFDENWRKGQEVFFLYLLASLVTESGSACTGCPVTGLLWLWRQSPDRKRKPWFWWTSGIFAVNGKISHLVSQDVEGRSFSSFKASRRGSAAKVTRGGVWLDDDVSAMVRSSFGGFSEGQFLTFNLLQQSNKIHQLKPKVLL